MSDPAERPLEGVRILDFTRVLAGPYATLLLQDMGAEVIKVEDPGAGDDTRVWGPPFLPGRPDASAYFGSLNRGKLSIGLDLRRPESQEVVAALARSCHVAIQNFRPSTAVQLGVDPATLRHANPRLVTCSISGFGDSGPYGDLPGTEIVVEAMSGVMSVTGPPDGEPARFGVAMVDIATGLTAVTRILAALVRAGTSGVGAHVEASLYATAVGVLGTLITSYSATGEVPSRWGSHHPSLCPYGGFRTADGHLITGVINDRSWPELCDALGLDDLAGEERLRTNAGRVAARDEVEAAIHDRLRTRTTAYWVDLLRARGLLAAPVRTVAEAVDDPGMRALDLLVELEDGEGIWSPRLHGLAHPDEQASVARLGADTVEVLARVGSLEPERITDLLEGGVALDGRVDGR